MMEQKQDPFEVAVDLLDSDITKLVSWNEDIVKESRINDGK